MSRVGDDTDVRRRPDGSAGASSCATWKAKQIQVWLRTGFPWHGIRILRAVQELRRLRLRRPEACPRCHDNGLVNLESTVSGRDVHLTWCCRGCSYEWPVTEGEQRLTERRSGREDRRAQTRADRRNRSRS
jgi:hypothetical protein